MKTFLRSLLIISAFPAFAMLRHGRQLFLWLAIVLYVGGSISAFSQGNLTPPPGTPAPSMKTLQQIQPRTPISSVPFTISSRGSYYLTQNLSVSSGNAITVNANGITLDLNGFTITSTAASATGTAILINAGLQNITIVNGFIQGSVTQTGGNFSGGGFQNGIALSNTSNPPTNVRVSGISVSGCLSDGIDVRFNSTTVEHCNVNTVGGYGIYAETVSDSVAIHCGFDGLQVQTAQNCRGDSVGTGTGVYANLAAINCAGTSSTNVGLYALNATNCYGQTSTDGSDPTHSYGLNAFSATNCYGIHGGSSAGLNAYSAQGCYGESVSGAGVSATNATSCYGKSTSGTGISATNALNCYGVSTSYVGLGATTATNCYGMSSSTGLFTTVANGCYGKSTGSGTVGLLALQTAIGCYGECASGTGINAVIMVACTYIGSVTAAHRYLTGIGPDS